ncbi:hypothetical protein KJ612_11585 [Myxococcota bacterium]|nr:hypothetical protein [Myxococcota bacterium]
MDWDLTLEKLRCEAFRPTVPPPVRLPSWAVAALVGAGLTLSGAACDRGGSGDRGPAADMGQVHVEYGAPMPPDMLKTPPVPDAVEPLYAGPPEESMPAEGPPPVEEYRAPIMRQPAPKTLPPPPTEEMKVQPPDPGAEVPLYAHPAMRKN